MDSWTEAVLKNSFSSIVHAPTNIEHWEGDIVGHTYDAALVTLDGAPAIVGAAVLYRDIFYGIARDIMTKGDGDDEDRVDWRVSMECYFTDFAAYWKGRVYTKDSQRWEELSPYIGGLFQNRPVIRLLGGAGDDSKVYFGAKGLVAVPADPDARLLQATWIDPQSGEQTVKNFEATAAARIVRVSKDPIVLSSGSLTDPASVLYRVEELEATRGETAEGYGEFVPSAQTLSTADSGRAGQVVEDVTDEVDPAETIDYGMYRLAVEQKADQVMFTVNFLDHDGEYRSAAGYLVSEDEAPERRAFLMELLEENHKETSELVQELDTMIEATKDGTNETETWGAKYINNLPDAAFAVILSGGKRDDEGKTTPRSNRKLSHHNASVKNGSDNGTVDLQHLRNTLACLPVTDLPADAKRRAKSHLAAHARSLLKDWKDEGAAAATATARNTSDERGDIAMTPEEIRNLLKDMLGDVDLGTLAALVEEHNETLKGHAAWIAAREAEQRVAERLAQIGADTGNERLAKLAATLGDEDWEAVASAITSAREDVLVDTPSAEAAEGDPPAKPPTDEQPNEEPPTEEPPTEETPAEAAEGDPLVDKPTDTPTEAAEASEGEPSADEPPTDEPPTEEPSVEASEGEPSDDVPADEPPADEPPAGTERPTDTQAAQAKPQTDPSTALFVVRTPDGRTVAANTPQEVEHKAGYEGTFATLFASDRHKDQ
jgi:hypothetical protein